MRLGTVAKRLGAFFFAGTLIALLLAVALPRQVRVGPLDVSGLQLLRWWFLIGLVIAAAGLALEGTAEVRKLRRLGQEAHAWAQLAVSAVLSVIALVLAVQVARW